MASGLFLETLVDLRLTDDWQHMLDGITVRAHSRGGDAKGALIMKALVEPRQLCEPDPRPLRRSKTPSRLCHDDGETSDYLAVRLLDMPVANPNALLADKSYHGDDVRRALLIRAIQRVIPPKADRKELGDFGFSRLRIFVRMPFCDFANVNIWFVPELIAVVQKLVLHTLYRQTMSEPLGLPRVIECSLVVICGGWLRGPSIR